MPASQTDRTPPDAAQWRQLLQDVRRGEVIHPRLKPWLVHFGLAEFRCVALVLTAKGRRLAEA